MKWIFTLWFTLFLTQLFLYRQNNSMYTNNILKGTTIITSISQDKIIIAADSKQTWAGDSLLDNPKAPLKCKIRHNGNLFFAAEGYTTMIKPHIDFLEIIEKLEIENKQTFARKIDFIKLMLREPIQVFLQNFQKKNPISFKLISVSFSQFENEKPRNVALFWEVKSTSKGWEVIANQLTSDIIPRYMIQGHKNAIDDYLANNPSFGNKIFDEKGVNELIELQIKELPLKVGLPIDIVVLTSEGYHWIQKKGQCN